MLIFDHRALKILLILLSFLAASLVGWTAAQRWKKFIRIPLRFVSALVGLASCLLLFIDGCDQITTERVASAPIYSPDRRHAIVVRDWNEGAFGAGTNVRLYSALGFREEEIGGGEYNVIYAGDVRWRSNNDVILRFDGRYQEKPFCESTASVHVTCVPRP